MSKSIASGAVVEIIERDQGGYPDAHYVVIPNELRINGVRLLCPEDAPPVVHEISPSGHEPVRVTVTLWARRVLVGAESDVASQPEILGDTYFTVEPYQADAERPIRIGRRMPVDGEKSVVVDVANITVERAEQLAEELRVAVWAARHLDEDADGAVPQVPVSLPVGMPEGEADVHV